MWHRARSLILVMVLLGCDPATDQTPTSSAIGPTAPSKTCAGCVLPPTSFSRNDQDRDNDTGEERGIGIGHPEWVRRFPADPRADYLFVIQDDGKPRTSAIVLLNGRVIVGPVELRGAAVTEVRKSVLLQVSNRLRVIPLGARGARVRVWILGGTKVVGPNGGTVSSPGQQVRISIPPGALTSSLEISSTPTDVYPGGVGILPGAVHEMSPSGISFARPAILTLTYNPLEIPAGIPESNIGLFHAIGGRWTVVQGTSVNLSSHSVTGPIESFSEFGVGFALPAQPNLRLPLPGGKHWLLSTEIGSRLPAPLCAGTGGVGGRFYGDPNDPDCEHRASTQFSLDFIDENQEQGDLSGSDVAILAAGDGTVRFAGSSATLGNLVVLDHGTTSFSTWYGHMKNGSLRVAAGATVRQGQEIGIMGNTGTASTGVHIHFGVKYNNQGADAAAVLNQTSVDGMRLTDYKVGSVQAPTFYLSSNTSQSVDLTGDWTFTIGTVVGNGGRVVCTPTSPPATLHLTQTGNDLAGTHGAISLDCFDGSIHFNRVPFGDVAVGSTTNDGSDIILYLPNTNWINRGALTAPNRMGGTAEVELGTVSAPLTATGPWQATR